MKKQITAILIASILAIMAPITISAQTRYCAPRNSEYRGNSRNVRTYYDERSSNNRYREVRRPNVYNRHRTAFNLAIGTGAGAVLGGLIGGKKGVLIGAAAGLAGGAIVTKVQKPKNYYRYR